MQNEWSGFVVFARERLQILEKFRSVEVSTKRSCDNIECRVLNAIKTDLRRCAACKLAFYCSKQCQTVSWQKYNHRTVCAGTCPGAPKEQRDVRFHHFAILHDYQAQKADLLLQKLAHITQNGNIDYCVTLEYRAGRCTANVEPISRYQNTIERHPAVNWSCVDRKEIHIVRIFNGWDEEAVQFALVLRSNTSIVFDQLARLARSIPPGRNLIKLLTSCPSIIQQVHELAGVPVVETYEGDANL
ncbi:hypothetical protein R3P38DRAFT_2561093 [Favolaschia claudopus]|uniref:MYND-type domain-containing protein n=1 Tax=Favolaschia claudopus TaxID=2862362 RepID=A0AAW0A2Y4_9AGAR